MAGGCTRSDNLERPRRALPLGPFYILSATVIRFGQDLLKFNTHSEPSPFVNGVGILIATALLVTNSFELDSFGTMAVVRNLTGI